MVPLTLTEALKRTESFYQKVSRQYKGFSSGAPPQAEYFDLYECKLTDSPRMTKSIHVVLADLKLDHLYIVYPGEERFPLAERVTAIGLADIRRGLL